MSTEKNDTTDLDVGGGGPAPDLTTDEGVAEALAALGLTVAREETFMRFDGEARRWITQGCPFKETHPGEDPDKVEGLVLRHPDGRVHIRCQSGRCRSGRPLARMLDDLRLQAEDEERKKRLAEWMATRESVSWDDLPDDPAPDEDDEKGAPSPGGRKQSEEVVALAEGLLLFHDPQNEPHVAQPRGSGTVAVPTGSKQFEAFLRRRYWEAHGRPVSPQAIAEAAATLSARAAFEGPTLPVHLRVAEVEGACYVDMARDDGQVIRATADGWEVVAQPEDLVFRRTQLMRPLPVPTRGDRPGAGLALLGRHVRASVRDLVLVLAFLVQALRPKGPYPLLVLQGEQGVGKSWTSRTLRSLVDDSEVPSRAAPRGDHDLVLAAENQHLVVFDNMSDVSPALSDGLCRLATGGGFGTRKLYSGREEEVFYVQRPVLLNGIESPATRPDLGDRALAVELLPIPKEERQPESVLDRAFARDRAAIFGGLLDALVASLRHAGDFAGAELPRMADFAVNAMAASRVFPAGYPAFADAYEANRQEAVDEAVASSPVAEAVLALLSRRPGGAWEGTMAGLIEALRPYLPDPLRPPRDFPRNPQAMAGALKRVEPALRAVGVEREQLPRRGRTGQRAFRLALRQDEGSPVPSPQVPPSTSDTSASSARADGSDDTDD